MIVNSRCACAARVTVVIASSPGPSRERGPGIHCMRMRWIFVEGVVTRHSQTRERVVKKRPTITIIGGETNKTGLAVLPTLPSLGSITNGKTSLFRIPWEARRRRFCHGRWSTLPFFALA